MKRSEMVTKIQILLESRGYVGNNDDGEAVVNLIEEAGMLPPSRTTTMGEYFGLDKNDSEYDLISHGLTVNKWEPEEGGNNGSR